MNGKEVDISHKAPRDNMLNINTLQIKQEKSSRHQATLLKTERRKPDIFQ